MAWFPSRKPVEEEARAEAEVNQDDPNVETSINTLDFSSSSSTDWYPGSDSASSSWSDGYFDDKELEKFDDQGMEMVQEEVLNFISDWVISDESRSTTEEEFPVNVATLPVGVVLSVNGKQVIVEGKEKLNLLSKGSFLWITETGVPLGYVDEIFANAKKPCYSVRLKSESQVPQGISQGTQVSLIVADSVQHGNKGCDASFGNMPKKMAQMGMTSEQKTGNTANNKKVLGLGRSKNRGAPSPNLSDSQNYHVIPQAIAGTVLRSDSQTIPETRGLVPQYLPLPLMGRFAANREYPYPHPMANQMGILPNPVPSQAPAWITPMLNPMMYPLQHFSNGQNYINQPYPNAAPWPEMNSNPFPPHRQMKHLHPQTQPRQSQRLNAGPSSNRGRELHHRGGGGGFNRGFGRGRGRDQKQPG